MEDNPSNVKVLDAASSDFTAAASLIMKAQQLVYKAGWNLETNLER